MEETIKKYRDIPKGVEDSLVWLTSLQFFPKENIVNRMELSIDNICVNITTFQTGNDWVFILSGGRYEKNSVLAIGVVKMSSDDEDESKKTLDDLHHKFLKRLKDIFYMALTDSNNQWKLMLDQLLVVKYQYDIYDQGDEAKLESPIKALEYVPDYKSQYLLKKSKFKECSESVSVKSIKDLPKFLLQLIKKDIFTRIVAELSVEITENDYMVVYVIIEKTMGADDPMVVIKSENVSIKEKITHDIISLTMSQKEINNAYKNVIGDVFEKINRLFSLASSTLPEIEVSYDDIKNYL